MLVIYSVLVYLQEYFMAFFAVVSRNNLWISRIGIVMETLFIFVFYFKIISDSNLKKWFNGISILAFILLLYFDFSGEWKSYVDMEMVVYFVYLLLAIIIYYIQTFRNELVEYLFKDIGFLVGSVLLLSSSVVLLGSLFYNTIVYVNDVKIKAVLRLYHNINIVNVVGYNILFGIILWITRAYRK